MTTEQSTTGWVLVGLDGSRASRVAFSQAVSEAAWRQCGVLAVHVVVVPSLALYAVEPDGLDDLEAYGSRIVDRELEVVREEFGGEFPARVEVTSLIGSPSDELLDLAKNVFGTGPAKLIVVGSRGLGGVRGLLLGSVSTRILQHATCPVLIIRGVGADADDEADDDPTDSD